MNTELYLRIELVLLFCPYNLAQRRGTPDWQPTYSQKSTDTTGVAEQNINNSEFEPKLLNVFLIQSEPKNINIKSIVLLFSIVFFLLFFAGPPRLPNTPDNHTSKKVTVQ